MNRSLLQEVKDKPVTALIASVIWSVWLFLFHRRFGYDQVGLSYEKVVEKGEYWRLLTSAFSHVDLVHLAMNTSSLWSLGFVEKSKKMGSSYYLKVTLILLVLSKLILIGFYTFMVKVMKKEYFRRVTSVGYSGILFGWMANLSVGKHKQGHFKILGTTRIPMSLAPFASLIVTSALIPRSSFLGHLSGIVAGYLVGFGYFDWINIFRFLNR